MSKLNLIDVHHHATPPSYGEALRGDVPIPNVDYATWSPEVSHDDIEQSLSLPDGPQDVHIALRDARFDDAGQMVYVMDDFLNRNTILVNGKPWPCHGVQKRRCRFRLWARMCTTATSSTTRRWA